MSEKEKKKRRPGRRAYLNDFKPTADGSYTYAGKMHVYLGPFPWKRAMTVLWSLTGVALAAGVTAGCIPAAGTTNCFYVILPFVAALGGAVSVTWLMVRLTLGGRELRDYIYKRTVLRARFRGRLTAALSLVAMACEVFYLILHGARGLAGGTAAFLICLILEFVSAVGWTRLFERLKWAD